MLIPSIVTQSIRIQFSERKPNMLEISVTEAKNKFDEIIKQVEQGEKVTVTREGKAVAFIENPKQKLPSRIDLRDMQKPAEVSSTKLLREMREEGY